MTFGHELSELMEEKNLTARDISDAIGVSIGTISTWLSRIKEPHKFIKTATLKVVRKLRKIEPIKYAGLLPGNVGTRKK